MNKAILRNIEIVTFNKKNNFTAAWLSFFFQPTGSETDFFSHRPKWITFLIRFKSGEQAGIFNIWALFLDGFQRSFWVLMWATAHQKSLLFELTLFWNACSKELSTISNIFAIVITPKYCSQYYTNHKVAIYSSFFLTFGRTSMV